jgi:hypothetical protein
MKSIKMSEKMKWMKVLMMGILFTLLISTKGYSQTTEPLLSDEDQQKSDLFKSQNGSDRRATFTELERLIRPLEAVPTANISSKKIGANTSTKEEIIILLGEPNNTIQKSIFQYLLKGNGFECRVDIGFNADGFVSFYVIKDCN